MIWGFHLGELSFSAFKSSNMFDRRWHLRRERFGECDSLRPGPGRPLSSRADSRTRDTVAYQAAMLICLAAECTATYSLSKCACSFFRRPAAGRADLVRFELEQADRQINPDEDLQDHVEKRFAPAHLYNNDIIDMEISTIVLAVSVACLFGADFFLCVSVSIRVSRP